ncbi:hypothetical protein C5Y96_17095 [Blastopirellula marina]|uniref:Schlafen AlbA-2 domain-containing protein n=1 Tax=Blastopirellula marina TaxID=124 RepID=A0A2S8F7G4_9BACT|nr:MULTISPECIES: ATP-binding protein [Pirellulaceae]PQO28088.1 hypothetical protein C5Y96_17095 [Blastopirellula marina]RCS48514.1 ATP-binding protein [Bremerella cremea]
MPDRKPDPSFNITDFEDAESLLDYIQTIGENVHWEYKARGEYSKNANALKAKVSREVSAFANTEGGYLVFGVSETLTDRENGQVIKSRSEMKPDRSYDYTYNIDGWDSLKTMDAMESYLNGIVSKSVMPNLIQFKVVRVNRRDKAQDPIFVAIIEKSDTAPHQTNYDDKHFVYYWRQGDKSEQAPHYHLENLRNRVTRTVLRIEGWQFVIPKIEDHTANYYVEMTLQLFIRNVTFQIATHWGIHVKNISEHSNWKPIDSDGSLESGIVVGNPNAVILPTQLLTVNVRLKSKVPTHPIRGSLNSMLEARVAELTLLARPISQNNVGEEVELRNMGDGRLEQEIHDKLCRLHGR